MGYLRKDEVTSYPLGPEALAKMTRSDVCSLEESAADIATPEPRRAALVELRGIVKTYRLGEVVVEALRGIDLAVYEGEFAAIWGPSGSGKSTLLNLIGLIDSPTSGSITWGGRSVVGLNDRETTRLRNRNIGFIFQSFNLVPVMSALENVMLPLQVRRVSGRKARSKARDLLGNVGLADKAGSRPDKLSGGQRQRVAIARALVTEPRLIVADEPTANLDSENSRRILDLMRDLNRKMGATFLFSTHDLRVLDQIDRRIDIRDGKLAYAEPEPLHGGH
jgi:putative ABC transport system ATP-binding protein